MFNCCVLCEQSAMCRWQCKLTKVNFSMPIPVAFQSVCVYYLPPATTISHLDTSFVLRGAHHRQSSLSGTSYAQMYKDVRAAVDLCHRDGTLKQAVAREPSKYINEDRQIVPLLKMLRQSGRLTFLVTNR
jgi:hypothetical protein